MLRARLVALLVTFLVSLATGATAQPMHAEKGKLVPVTGWQVFPPLY
jgi:hypothetical protein